MINSLNSGETEEVLAKLMQIPENKICFECGENAQWASVNNGIFLCLNCSGMHRNFGVMVSFVRSVRMDTWSDKQLNYMIMGGNAKLRAFFESYNIPKDSPIDFKFKTKAGKYYRDMLKALVENTESPEPPNFEEALQLLDFTNPNFVSTPQEPETKQKSTDLFVKNVMGLFETTKNKSKELYNKANDKYHDPKFQEDMGKFKTQVAEKSKEIGQKSKEVAKKGYESMKTVL